MAPTALSWLGIVPATLAWLVISFPMSIFWRKKPIADPHMDMRGKTVIVTGANCGIGFRSAAWLSKMGATVILACRSTERGLAAEKAIKEELETPLASFPYRDTGRVVFHKLDLGDFESIRSFASTICQGYMNIDVLINNAGLNDGKMTKQGLDEVFGVNFLGHFLLTILLLEKLKNNFRGARIINVSSVVHRFSPSKPDFEASANGMDKMHNYQNSKLAMVLFTKELRRRLKGTQVSAYAVSPGAVRSEIWRSWRGVSRGGRGDFVAPNCRGLGFWRTKTSPSFSSAPVCRSGAFPAFFCPSSSLVRPIAVPLLAAAVLLIYRALFIRAANPGKEELTRLNQDHGYTISKCWDWAIPEIKRKKIEWAQRKKSPRPSDHS